MKKSCTSIALMVLLTLAGCKSEKTGQVQIVVIDGIRHIMNPEVPLK